MFVYANENKLAQFLAVFCVTLVEFFVSVSVVYFVTFTFGAYLFENVAETVLFGAFMSALCIMPTLMLCEHRNPLDPIDRVLLKNEFESSKERVLTNLAYGAIVGAWLGALVIPLDWDRWWQEWPVSCMMGASCGSVCGVLVDSVKRRFKSKVHI
jgi:phosphatidylinositol glycan class F